MHFAALTGVRAMIETRPLDEVKAAYDRTTFGQARYRMVVTTGREAFRARARRGAAATASVRFWRWLRDGAVMVRTRPRPYEIGPS